MTHITNELVAWHGAWIRCLIIKLPYYNDVIMGALRPKSPASRLFTQPFIQAEIKENIKAPRHWPLCGEFTGTGEFPAQMASNAENVSIWWRHHETFAQITTAMLSYHVHYFELELWWKLACEMGSCSIKGIDQMAVVRIRLITGWIHHVSCKVNPKEHYNTNCPIY